MTEAASTDDVDCKENLLKCEVCSEPADMKCSLCKLVSYCSKEHQKSHWKIHKTLCREFDVTKKEKGKGCILKANRDLAEGKCLLQETPLLIGPTTEPVCLGCLRPLPSQPPIYTCPLCAWPACSPRCRGLTSPTSHLPECIILSKNKTATMSGDNRYEAILPLRCLVLQKLNSKKFHQILAMESFMEERKNNEEVYNEAEENVVKYLVDNYLSKLEGESALKDISPRLLHQIAAVIDANGLEVRSGGADLMVLYPTFPMFQHSCVPNLRYIHKENLRICISTIGKVDCGEILTTSYSNSLWSTVARRDQLKSERYFDCRCQRCTDPTELGSHFGTLKCIHTVADLQCSGYLLAEDPLDYQSDWKCTKCDAMLDFNQVKDLLGRLGEQVENTMEKASIAKLEDLLTNLQRLLHKNHQHCYMVKHSLIQLYGREKNFLMEMLSEENLNRKIALCEELRSVNAILDPSDSQLILYQGVILHELYMGWMEKCRRGQTNVSKPLSYLNRCVELLNNELPGTAGGNLLRIANATMASVKARFQV